jgi:hypothetical protein
LAKSFSSHLDQSATQVLQVNFDNARIIPALDAIRVKRGTERVMVGDSMHGVRVRVLPDGRMDRKNAAQYVGCQPKALAMWALQGKGPRSVLLGGRRFYFKCDLDAFVRGDQAA